MLRAHAIGGFLAQRWQPSGTLHSRAAFYLITTAFDQVGMRGSVYGDQRARSAPTMTAVYMGSATGQAMIPAQAAAAEPG